MTAEATFVSGDPMMIDYTPGAGDIAAGQVIVLDESGLSTLIAHKDIANTVLGAVAAGGGVYSVKYLSTYAAGVRLYWDDTNNKVTVDGSMPFFGYALETASAANTYKKALHMPHVL